MSLEKYVKQANVDMETELAKVDEYLLVHVTTLLSLGYQPELNQSKELDAK